jgi:putative selenium metabolism protein SsnA
MKTKIENGIIITLDSTAMVLYDHELIYDDDLIIAIMPKGEYPETCDTVIDATGKVVMPGYINAHMHFYSTMVRGLGKAAPSTDFGEVLKNLWWRLDEKITHEDIYYSALIMQLEAIRKGCTTLVDHHAGPGAIAGSLDVLARSFAHTSLRGCLCYELSDRNGVAVTEAGLAENERFIRACQSHPSKMMGALFGLHASFTLSDHTLQRAAAIASSLDAGFHIHVAEAESDQDQTYAISGKRVVQRLYDAGILGPKTIAAHCVHIDETERALLAETNTMVVHNPQSNLNNAVGIADLVALDAEGILIGLGTDAMTVDMPQEVRVALWAQHLKQHNPSAGFMEVARTLYCNNRQIAGRVIPGLNTGILQPGAAADIILVDYLPPTPLTDESALGHLIFGISGAPVDTTIVAGKTLMQNHRILLDIDEAEIAARSRTLSAALWNRF